MNQSVAAYGRVRARLVGALATFVIAAGVVLAAQGERFSATAVNMSVIGRQGALGPVDIILERFSTQAERQRFHDALASGGSQALLQAFQKAPSIGKFGAPGRIGYDIRYAAELEGEDGGRRIVLASDRRMSFFEVQNRPRTFDYPFTVVVIEDKPDGSGKGWASIYTDIRLDKQKDTIVLENFADQPVMLTNVRSSK